jgi:hypothetical protein
MYGHAMKCDVCTTIWMIEPGEAELMDDLLMPRGWIRVYANQARKYGWDSGGPRGIEQAFDCCSSSCAREALDRYEQEALLGVSKPHLLT